MKWTRGKANDFIEYSSTQTDKTHCISITHTSYNNHYWYDYYNNRDKEVSGTFEAESWDEAEQIVVLKIRNELSFQAELWTERLKIFDKGMNANENLF